jgi:hypothetical protein
MWELLSGLGGIIAGVIVVCLAQWLIFKRTR